MPSDVPQQQPPHLFLATPSLEPHLRVLQRALGSPQLWSSWLAFPCVEALLSEQVGMNGSSPSPESWIFTPPPVGRRSWGGGKRALFLCHMQWESNHCILDLQTVNTEACISGYHAASGGCRPRPGAGLSAGPCGLLCSQARALLPRPGPLIFHPASCPGSEVGILSGGVHG